MLPKVIRRPGFWSLIVVAVAIIVGPAASLSSAEWGRNQAHLNPPRGEFAQPGSQDQTGIHGEYGLWVRNEGRRVEVDWITRDAAEGFLHVVIGDQVRHRFSTPASTSHRATFTRPRSGHVRLLYGSTRDTLDRHETTLFFDRETRTKPVFSGVDSLFIVGDVHGEFNNLIQLLRNAGVIDANLRWSGGRAHLVLLGDLMDRGPDVTRVLWFLYQLEREAERQQGRVHVMLGNHEIMVFLHDLRYVHPKEQLLAHLRGVDYAQLFDIRQSVLGRWLATKPAVVRIDDVLLAHGGVTTDYLPFTVESYDDSLSTYVQEDLFYRWADSTYIPKMDSTSVRRRENFFWGENSAFWYRGYVQTDTAGNGLSEVLPNFRSRLHVVAHTPVPTIQVRFAGSLIAVHPRTPATEMLLLVRDGAAWKRFRIGISGPPERLEGAPVAR